MGDNVNVQVELAVMLVGIGVTTVEKVYDYFKTNGHDDATLAQIMAEVNARIARRS